MAIIYWRKEDFPERDNPNVYSAVMKLAKIDEFAKPGQSIKSFADANGIPNGAF